jgi:hypothetical protein
VGGSFYNDIVTGRNKGHRESSTVLAESAVNYFAWQPAAGVDLNLARAVRLRVEAAVRLTPINGLISGDSQQAQPRFSAGLVFSR